jgi:hypothetical protein
VGCCTIVISFVAMKSLNKTSRVLKDKPTIGSPIFMAFPCDRIPKVTEDVYVHFCIHSSSSSKFTSQFRERFEAAALEHGRRSS